MDVPIGESVLVNASAFTGAQFRSRESIPCDVLETDADRLLVRTRFPYRVFTMWVSTKWIEEADCPSELASV